jgi:hypothetical protein
MRRRLRFPVEACEQRFLRHHEPGEVTQGRVTLENAALLDCFAPLAKTVVPMRETGNEQSGRERMPPVRIHRTRREQHRCRCA